MGTGRGTDQLWSWGWYEDVQEVKLHLAKFCRTFPQRIGRVEWWQKVDLLS